VRRPEVRTFAARGTYESPDKAPHPNPFP